MNQKIYIVMGSKSDKEKLSEVFDMLDGLGIPLKVDILSAHRNPDELRQVCVDLEKNGFEVVIAIAGMAAALPGFVAAYVNIPVLGVAMKGGAMDGMDALLSMTSIPKGVAVACTGIGKSAFINAAIMALQILALKDEDYKLKLAELKKKYK